MLLQMLCFRSKFNPAQMAFKNFFFFEASAAHVNGYSCLYVYHMQEETMQVAGGQQVVNLCTVFPKAVFFGFFACTLLGPVGLATDTA